jgi:CheY-like chemotaxis protein
MSGTNTILVVDDDPDQVDAVRIVLENEDYRVVAAYDAEEALSRAETERPDLIILDIMMPEGTEGFHFVWKLRQQRSEYFQKVPIVVLTAIHSKTALRFYPDSSDGTYQAGEYLPVQDFVDKPVRPAELVRTVRRLLATEE